MSLINGNALQIGNSGTASQNATLTANGDGTFTLARGNVGATTQDLLTIDANGVVSIPQKNLIKSGAVIATTSGTSHDFTGIPSWVKKITLMFDGVSVDAGTIPMIQLGDLGGIETSGYLGSTSEAHTIVTSELNSAGFRINTTAAGGAPSIYHGMAIFTLLDAATNTWAASGMVGLSNSATTGFFGGSKSLTATLDRIRLTTLTGTANFDAGKINILMEG